VRFVHPEHGVRAVRLAYCMNLHAGETLGAVREGIERITLPLRDRLARGAPFGVGAYFPSAVASRLVAGGGELAELADWLAGEGLEAFTFNAFPYGGFHADGLKERVYRPTWANPERATYTLAVAHVAAALNAGRRDGHVSISTHPGAYGAWIDTPRDLMACATGIAGVVERFASLERAGGPRLVLSLEAEPRASAGNTRELAEFLVVARHPAEQALAAAGHQGHKLLAARHLGACLDCCHTAVEFEEPDEAVRLAGLGGALGKVQFSSALALARPVANAAGRAALLALDEPRYLHQVRGGHAGGARESAADLPELAAALADGGGAWLACDEWRCHFHVPVDLETACGLSTTRAHADRVLDVLLADPGAWTTDELHLEIETYTWDVLPGGARGDGELVDGLEREYAHVIGRLEGRGWRRA
jgi:hypothetical protein